MANSMKLMPQLNVFCFSDVGKFSKAYKKKVGKVPEIRSDYQCSTLSGVDYISTCSFILVKGFDGSAGSMALLAHECSHAVDAWFDEMGESDPGTEIRAYALQSCILSCLTQLGVK